MRFIHGAIIFLVSATFCLFGCQTGSTVKDADISAKALAHSQIVATPDNITVNAAQPANYAIANADGAESVTELAASNLVLLPNGQMTLINPKETTITGLAVVIEHAPDGTTLVKSLTIDSLTTLSNVAYTAKGEALAWLETLGVKLSDDDRAKFEKAVDAGASVAEALAQIGLKIISPTP